MPAAILSSVVLPEPEGPSRHKHLARLGRQADVAQRFGGRAEGVADMFEGQPRREGDACRDTRLCGWGVLLRSTMNSGAAQSCSARVNHL